MEDNEMALKEEKMKILGMVEEGKITSEEAIELMEALEKQEDRVLTTAANPKWLKVRVIDEKDNVKVKVNFPLSLVDIGLKLGTAFSPELREAGLKQEDIQEILEAVKSGAEGKIVDVFDEESKTKVEVFVE